MSEFKLPDVGEGLESAEIVEWLIAEGDTVQRDQPLVEILTDKSQTQLPSPRAGIVTRLGFAEGDIAEVGQVLLEFSDAGAPSTPSPQNPSTGDRPDASTTTAPPVESRMSGARPKAAPVVRRRALESGLDLASVTGTGPGGRITNADLDEVLRAGTTVSSGATSTPPSEVSRTTNRPGAQARSEGLGAIEAGVHPLRGIRRVTSEAMTRSWQIPHIHTQDEADATELLIARKWLKRSGEPGADALTLLALFVMAVTQALREFPIVNSSIDPDAGEITVHPNVNIGFAVAADHGLSVPVIADADQRSLLNLASEIQRLTSAVRTRSVSTSELRGGTATISNYGSLGGRFASPIIRSPEVIIVGFGSVKARPFVVDGVLTARPTLPVCIGADHRLLDGDVVTAFAEFIIGRLSDPVQLLDHR